MGTKLSLECVKEALDEERENLKHWNNLLTQYGTYGICRTMDCQPLVGQKL